MSVGAGSIKRAANAINTSNAVNTTTFMNTADSTNADSVPNTANAEGIGTENVETAAARAESIIQKAESRLAARKAAEGKPVSQRTSAPAAGRGQTTGKSAAGKAEVKPDVKGKAELKPDTREKAELGQSEEKAAAGISEEQTLPKDGKISRDKNEEMGLTIKSAEMETAAENGTRTYIIYGIGQELPIYLL